MIIEKLQARVTDVYQQEANVQAIPPGIISIIIDTILSVVTGCTKQNQTPTQMVETINKAPIIAEVRVRQAIRAAGLSNHPQREKIVATAMKTMMEAKEQDVQEAQQEIDFIM